MTAESHGLSGVAVSAPVESLSFCNLSKDRIRTLTVEAVVKFANCIPAHCSIHKIACIELPPQSVDDSVLSQPQQSLLSTPPSVGISSCSTPQSSTSPSLSPSASTSPLHNLLPGRADMMVLALFGLLEQTISAATNKKSSSSLNTSLKKSAISEDEQILKLSAADTPCIVAGGTHSLPLHHSVSSVESPHKVMNIVTCNVPLSPSFFKSVLAFNTIFG